MKIKSYNEKFEESNGNRVFISRFNESVDEFVDSLWSKASEMSAEELESFMNQLNEKFGNK